MWRWGVGEMGRWGDEEMGDREMEGWGWRDGGMGGVCVVVSLCPVHCVCFGYNEA